MGGNSSSRFSTNHILHYTKPDENRLYLFDTSTERFYNYPCFSKGKPFFFAKLSTVMVSQHSKLFILGGLAYKETNNFKYLHKKGSQGELPLSGEENETLDLNDVPGEDNSDLDENNTHTISFYAKLDSGYEELTSTSIIGYFDIYKTRVSKLNFNFEKNDQFDYEISNSIIVYTNSWIYIFGGIIDGNPSGKSKKLHVDQGILIDISSIDPSVVRNDAGAVAVKDMVYVFDSKSELQRIHKYSISFDVWEQIEFKTPGFLIPPTVRPNVFYNEKSFLLYLNGKGENDVQHMNYFVYNLESDMFVQERSDRKLLMSIEDNQGDRDYTHQKKIYTHLSDSCVKVFFKETWLWETIDVYFIKIKKQKALEFSLNTLGCFSKRKLF